MNTEQNDYYVAYQAAILDTRYQRNIEYGEPRPGHPEGKVKYHIKQLESMVAEIRHLLLDPEEYWKLRLIIAVHDSFKMESKRNVRTTDYNSHASIAARFAFDMIPDPALATVVQYHDEPFAIFRKQEHTGRFDRDRFDKFWNQVTEKRLFVIFHMLDSSTPGKKVDRILWFHKHSGWDKVEWVSLMLAIVQETSRTLGLGLDADSKRYYSPL